MSSAAGYMYIVRWNGASPCSTVPSIATYNKLCVNSACWVPDRQFSKASWFTRYCSNDTLNNTDVKQQLSASTKSPVALTVVKGAVSHSAGTLVIFELNSQTGTHLPSVHLQKLQFMHESVEMLCYSENPKKAHAILCRNIIDLLYTVKEIQCVWGKCLWWTDKVCAVC